jgi:hypothetical protein
MKNRAKCKLCNDIIESFHQYDYVTCKCGEISVDGGESLKCFFKNKENFLRVDDEGNTIIPKFIEKEDESEKKEGEINLSKDKRQNIIDNIDNLIKTVESLPKHVMEMPIMHYDYVSLLMLLSSVVKLDSKD